MNGYSQYHNDLGKWLDTHYRQLCPDLYNLALICYVVTEYAVDALEFNSR